MLLAVVGTLLRQDVVDYQWTFIAFFVGPAIGVPLAYLNACGDDLNFFRCSPCCPCLQAFS